MTLQIEARLAQHSITAANINVDGWLNLLDKRFSPDEPAKHFYQNAIRFDELFTQLVIPLRNQRSANFVTDFTEETAKTFRKHTYNFKNVDVVLVEGIFLFNEITETYLTWPSGSIARFGPRCRARSNADKKVCHPPRRSGLMKLFISRHKKFIWISISRGTLLI